MKATDHFVTQPTQQTLQDLNTDPFSGLSKDQVQERLLQFGYNEIQTPETSLFKRLFKRFWGPIPWMIEAAALLSALAQKWEDFAIIIVLLLVNALLDFFQEHRALNALKVLKSSLDTQATVLRGGLYTVVPSRDLVPGDIVQLKMGDLIPADVQLLSGDYLLIDESVLTGESLPINKTAQAVAYANTIVKQGLMLAIVINTAAQTRFHSVVELIAHTQQNQTSHLQKMVLQIGHFLIISTLVLAAIIIIVSLGRGDSVNEVLRFVLVLVIASIPVALPAVLSVTMAVGAMNLAKRHVIVSRLTAIEELAGMDIFCSDKTGTLTQNKMQVSQPLLAKGVDEVTLFANALMASRVENQDPIELPLFHYMQQHHPDWEALGYQPLKFTPFNSNEKSSQGDYRFNNETFTAIKGAAQVILKRCQLAPEAAQVVAKQIEDLGSHGYRTLAIARQNSQNIEFLGLIPLYDPPREDSKHTIELIQSRGVQVKMITGDNLAIAKEIGRLLGLKGPSIQASQLTGSHKNVLIELAEMLSQAIYQTLKSDVGNAQAQAFSNDVIKKLKLIYDTSQLDRNLIYEHESVIIELIENTEIFAEVIPEDKYKIVDILQKHGHIVGMTGDGVNDAPALKKANCGIAVSGATDAARASADIILTKPGLSVINDAITQARETFARMKTYATFRIAETIRLILFMTLSIVFFNFYPVTAVMIIIVALLNDLPILAIAFDRVKISQQPVRWQMKRLLTLATVLGITGVTSSFLLIFTLQYLNYSHEMIQSLIFLKLVVAGHFTLWILRSEHWFWQQPWPSPLLFWAIMLTALLGTLFAVYGVFIQAIGWEHAALIWGYALVWMLINDTVKMTLIQYLDRPKPKLITIKA